MSKSYMALLYYLLVKIEQRITMGKGSYIAKYFGPLFGDSENKKNKCILDIFSDAMHAWQYNSPNRID